MGQRTTIDRKFFRVLGFSRFEKFSPRKFFSMDLPKLNDARRVSRLVMVFDELLNADQCDKPFTMSCSEFMMCGGIVKEDFTKKYSLYRQLVHATRDLKGYLRRGSLPSFDCVQKSKKWYNFYDNTVRLNELDDDDMKTKDFNRVLRMLIILQKFRKTLKKDYLQKDVFITRNSLTLSYDEFLKCGGKVIRKRCDKTRMRFKLDQQLRYAVEDLRVILERGRLYPPCVVAKAQRDIHLDPVENMRQYVSNPYIDTSDEEEIDDLDGGVIYPYDEVDNESDNEDDAYEEKDDGTLSEKEENIVDENENCSEFVMTEDMNMDPSSSSLIPKISEDDLNFD